MRSDLRTDTAALAGVKILDLMWIMAGPAATRMLADYGATVVRIESTRKLDAARTLQPFLGGQPAMENSAFFQNMNAGKLGMTLDITHPAGREVLLDLVRWCDVLTESFAAGALRSHGLDYDSLVKIKPDLIMLSTCMMGQTGPLAESPGYGNLSAGYAGFFELTGWPDRPPAGPFGAYTDYIAPLFAAIAIVAALDYHQRTGEGQYIDQSQVESALTFLGPAILDCLANGRSPNRNGNRDVDMAPHGVYPCAGTDRWIAIAVADDVEWAALCRAIERSELADDPRFSARSGRLAHAEEIDRLIAEWTIVCTPGEAEVLLQVAGVRAHSVSGYEDLYSDPQLTHRGHFTKVQHPMHGEVTIEGARVKMSRTPAKVERAGPTIGEHNLDVLQDILGYSDERVAELAAMGVLE